MCLDLLVVDSVKPIKIFFYVVTNKAQQQVRIYIIDIINFLIPFFF